MYAVEYTWMSSEISVTTKHIITASPSIRMPTPNSMLPFCHHVRWWTTGVTTASPWPPSAPNTPRPSARRPPSFPPVALSTRSIHW